MPFEPSDEPSVVSPGWIFVSFAQAEVALLAYGVGYSRG